MTTMEKEIIDFAAETLKKINNSKAYEKLPANIQSDVCLALVKLGRITKSAMNEVK